MSVVLYDGRNPNCASINIKFSVAHLLILFNQHSGNVVKLNKWLKIQVVIHTILSLQYNRHSFNILSYPGDLLCFILDIPCAISETVNG